VCVSLYIVFQSPPFHRVESVPSFTPLDSLPLSFKRLAHLTTHSAQGQIAGGQEPNIVFAISSYLPHSFPSLILSFLPSFSSLLSQNPGFKIGILYIQCDAMRCNDEQT
jgi:hypothetical protein